MFNNRNASALGAGVLLFASAVTAAPAVPDDLNARLGLTDSTVIELDVDRTPGVTHQIAVAIDGADYMVELEPVSLRAHDYHVYTADADEVLHEVEAAPERTFRGSLREDPGSLIAASILDDGLYARVELTDGAVRWIEPVARYFPERGDLAGLHVVYDEQDVLDTGHVCATTVRHMVNRQVGGEAGGTATPGQIFEAELACDADFNYFQDYGSSTQQVEDRINAVINQVNVQYERDVQITHRITTILVRTSTVYTTTDPEALLTQFRNRWNNNHGGIQRDVAHLFTGKNIDGGVIGIAFIGVICDRSLAYGLVESDFNEVFACATDLSAHELGHNWDAGHCSCPSHTMNPGITCTNVFSQESIDAIVSHRSSRTCLEIIDPVDPPPNDDCSNAAVVSNGSTAYTTVSATTDGPPLPAGCDEGAGLDLVSDIWFEYTAPCNGTVSVSLCNSSFDTRMAVYNDGNCPGSFVACNDDACGSGGLRSELTFSASIGATYLIRVGGFSGTGSGTMVIDCEGGTGPANDECDNAIAVGGGATDFNTTDATTDGPALPGSCDEGFGLSFVDDIWYAYTADCDGTATVSLCDSGYDTRLAIYQDGDCPGAFVACNDDACGPTGLQSEVEFGVTAGATYLVRIGGFNSQGSGTMVISCAGADCPEDIDNDGAAGFGDILRVLAVWGPCGGCVEDVDGNGAADFGDILRILAEWGPCP